MDEKVENARLERFKNKAPTYDEHMLLGVYKLLGQEQSASKYKGSSASKQRAAAAEQSKSVGIEPRKGTPVKK